MIAIHFVRNLVFSAAFPSQHCLYFFPLPQGQGSLRPVFAVFMTTRPPAAPLPPTASLPRTHTTEKRYGTPRFSGAFVAGQRPRKTAFHRLETVPETPPPPQTFPEKSEASFSSKSKKTYRERSALCGGSPGLRSRRAGGGANAHSPRLDRVYQQLVALREGRAHRPGQSGSPADQGRSALTPLGSTNPAVEKIFPRTGEKDFRTPPTGSIEHRNPLIRHEMSMYAASGTKFACILPSRGADTQMGLFLSAMLFAVVATAIPTSVSAVQVDIKYNITSGINNTAQLGGAAPTSGSATVRWQLTSLNGNFSAGGAATLRSLVISNAFGTLTLAPPFLYDATIRTLGAASGGRAYVFAGVPAPFTFVSFQHTPNLNVPPANFRAFFYYYTSLCTYCTLQPLGREISRVPEPHSSLLLALGLCGLAAGGTLLRRRGHPSA